MDSEEFEEYKNYINELEHMSDIEKEIELNDYLSSIDDMKKRIKLEKKSIFLLKLSVLRHIIPTSYLENINQCSSSICYESFYIYVIKKYIKEMIKKKNYSDTISVYQCLVSINMLGNYRDAYISSLLNYNEGLEKKDLNFNYNGISSDINKILKKIN